MNLASLRLEAPGSTLKPFLLMTLLETGKLDPKEQFICRRPLKIGSAQMDCTHPAEVALKPSLIPAIPTSRKWHPA
jgi:cell division protein FtsI/penicillin-binding protein 2